MSARWSAAIPNGCARAEKSSAEGRSTGCGSLGNLALDLIGQELRIFLIRFDSHRRAHSMMREPTELRAHNFELALHGRCEPNRCPNTRHRVLLHAHGRYAKAVNDVLACELDENRTIDG